MRVPPPVPHFCLLLWCLHANTAAADLDAPHNVTVASLNTNYTLRWEWSAADSPAVTFTTQYLARFKLRTKSPKWATVCDETPQRSCDLTTLNLHYLGIFVIRVRANVNGVHSAWVQREFCPDKDAQVGPPTKVDLVPAGSNLNVFISDPLTSSNASMKELLPNMFYHIVYWEQSQGPAQATLTLDSGVNAVTLPDLKAWTWYCVSVQTRCNFYSKNSSFTPPHCIQTEGAAPWWKVLAYFLGSFAISLLVVAPVLYGCFLFYKNLRSALYPRNQLPTHFLEDFLDSPCFDAPRLPILDSASELPCDRIVVCLEPRLPDRSPPVDDLQPDIGYRRSHGAGGSSGDSGVYSTGGLNPHQSSSSRSLSGAEDCSGGPLAPELKKPALISHEDIMVTEGRA